MFDLPKSTLIKRVIPKNAFDDYTNGRQKKMFTDRVLRITWLNTLSEDTTNMKSAEMEELHIFNIELKRKSDISELLTIIQRSIPYYIIIVVRYADEYFVTTSAKHKNPINENVAVIDYEFSSGWLSFDDAFKYKLNLKNNLDWVFKDFCEQLSSTKTTNSSDLSSLVSHKKELDILRKEINRLESKIARCKQYNKKVELNIRLNNLKEQMEQIDT